MVYDEAFLVADGSPYSLVGITGTMAAALAQNSVVFAMQAIANPAAGVPSTGPSQPVVTNRGPLNIAAISLAFTDIVAFTAAVTAGRRLELRIGTGTLPTGGANIAPTPKNSKDAGSDTGITGGQGVIATTAALGVAGFVAGSVPVGILDLTGFGTAGARLERFYAFDVQQGGLWLQPGEILYVTNPVAMDAAGTWQLAIEVDYFRRDYA